MLAQRSCFSLINDAVKLTFVLFFHKFRLQDDHEGAFHFSSSRFSSCNVKLASRHLKHSNFNLLDRSCNILIVLVQHLAVPRSVYFSAKVKLHLAR